MVSSTRAARPKLTVNTKVQQPSRFPPPKATRSNAPAAPSNPRPQQPARSNTSAPAQPRSHPSGPPPPYTQAKPPPYTKTHPTRPAAPPARSHITPPKPAPKRGKVAQWFYDKDPGHHPVLFTTDPNDPRLEAGGPLAPKLQRRAWVRLLITAVALALIFLAIWGGVRLVAGKPGKD